jgi:hypothetical protein
MRRVTVCKASPVGDQVIGSVTIEISRDLDEYLGPAQAFRGDAQLIRQALRALPMGTRDQLLIMMLEDAATVLRIPGADLEDKPDG